MIRVFYNYILFILWPFLSLVLNFVNLKIDNLNSYRNFGRNLFLFIGFFGLNYFVLVSGNSDDKRFQEVFLLFRSRIHEISQLYDYIYNSKAPLEIVFPILTFFASKFTGSLTIFFLTLALVFAFFYERNLRFLLKFTTIKDIRVLRYILFLFLFVFPFWDSINGFRFATGSHMFFYFVMKIYNFELNKFNPINYKYIFLIFPAFVHSSLLLVFFLFLFAFILTNNRLMFYVFILSWSLNNFGLVTKLNLSQYISEFSIGPEEQKKSLDGYLSEGTIENDRVFYNDSNWNIKVQKNLLNWIVFLFVIIVYLKLIKSNEIKEYHIFNFTLLLLSFGFFLEIENSSFGRYVKTGQLFLFLLSSRLTVFSHNKFSSFLIRFLITIYLILLVRLSFDIIPFNSFLPGFSILNPDKLKLVEWWEKYGGIND